MAVKVGELYETLELRDSKFNRGIASAKRRTGGLMRMLGPAGLVGAIAGVGFAFTKLTKDSLNEFRELETGMAEVFTLIPDATDNMKKEMIEDMEEFRMEMGVTSDEAVPALYQAISAGVPRKNVFEFLETAQKAAKGGVTDLQTSVDGLTSVVNAYGDEVIDARKASDLMFTSVRLGKTTFEELSANLSDVVPIASAVGVNFSDISAAISTMTAQGISTAKATTQLRMALNELSKEGSQASDTFKEMTGQTFPNFIKEGGNLQEAMGIMQKAAEENDTAIQNMFGNIRGGQAALALTGASAEKFKEDLNEMEESTGATDDAFETMMDTSQTGIDRLSAAMEVAKETLGDELAPLFDDFIDFLIGKMPNAIESVDGLGESIQDILDFLDPVFDSFRLLYDIVKFAFDGIADIFVQFYFIVDILSNTFKLSNLMVQKGMTEMQLLIAKGINAIIDKFAKLSVVPGLGFLEDMKKSSENSIIGIENNIADLDSEIDKRMNNITMSSDALGIAFAESGTRTEDNIGDIINSFKNLTKAGKNELEKQTDNVEEAAEEQNNSWEDMQPDEDVQGDEDNNQGEKIVDNFAWTRKQLAKGWQSYYEEKERKEKNSLKLDNWTREQMAKGWQSYYEDKKERDKEAHENSVWLDNWTREQIAKGKQAGTEWLKQQEEKRKQNMIDSTNARWSAYQNMLDKEKEKEEEKTQWLNEINNYRMQKYREGQLKATELSKEEEEKRRKSMINNLSFLKKGMSNAFANIMKGTQSVTEAFGTLWQGVIDTVIQKLAEMAATKVFEFIISGGLGGGGILSGIGSIFGGIFHDGGTVPGPIGQERLILAQGGETITPVGQTMSQGTKTANITIQLDGRTIARAVKAPLTNDLVIKGGVRA